MILFSCKFIICEICKIFFSYLHNVICPNCDQHDVCVFYTIDDVRILKSDEQLVCTVAVFPEVVKMNDIFIMINCTINNADIATLFAFITDTLCKGITDCNDIYIFVSEEIKCTDKSFEK